MDELRFKEHNPQIAHNQPLYKSQYLKRSSSSAGTSRPNQTESTNSTSLKFRPRTSLPAARSSSTSAAGNGSGWRFNEEPLELPRPKVTGHDLLTRDANRVSRLTTRFEQHNDLPANNLFSKRLNGSHSPIFGSPQAVKDDSGLLADPDSPTSRCSPRDHTNSHSSKQSAPEVAVQALREARRKILNNSPKQQRRPNTGPQQQESEQETLTEKQKQHRALELDCISIRETLKSLEERVRLQEELQSELFPHELEKMKERHSQELQLREKWLKQLEEDDEFADQEALQLRKQTMHKLATTQAQDNQPKRTLDGLGLAGLTERLDTSSAARNLFRFFKHPITLGLYICILIVFLLYIHMIFFDNEERSVRRTLGPEFYRVGWLEYSTRVF